jgi:hypothetical protein
LHFCYFINRLLMSRVGRSFARGEENPLTLTLSPQGRGEGT